VQKTLFVRKDKEGFHFHQANFPDLAGGGEADVDKYQLEIILSFSPKEKNALYRRLFFGISWWRRSAPQQIHPSSSKKFH